MRSIIGMFCLLAVSGCSPESYEEPISKDSQAVGERARWKKRVTGADLDTSKRWRVGGTDLGIPYVLENGSIGYLFGDTFAPPFTDHPGDHDWRSPVMLRSNVHPNAEGGIVFDSAAGVAGSRRAPEIMRNAHDQSKRWNPPTEFTVIPNDGISFPETKRQIISFMSVNTWDDIGPSDWRTGYAGLAYSDNGNDFIRLPDLVWPNDERNSDPYQMWSMQRDGDYVYIVSVRAGRQPGPMMLRRVHWEKMFDKRAYECWSNGAWGRSCTPLLNGHFGEPSLRKLEDGTWAMAYLTLAGSVSIVTRTAKSPTGPWSAAKVQVTYQDEPGLYGGFIHPWSKSGKDNLHIFVSKMTFANGKNTAYHVSQYVGTL